MPMPAPAPPRPPSVSAKTAPILSALTRPSLTPLPGGPPALTQAYALVLPSTGWAVFLQHGRSRVLPVFTGPAAVREFFVGNRVPLCRAFVLPTAEGVAEFLRSPPAPFGGRGEFLVAVDPLDLRDLTPDLFTARELVAALEGSGS